MPLSNPRMVFGVHSISPYSRTDGTSYGIAKVVGQFDASMQGNLIPQMGGSSKYPWAVEEGEMKADLSFTSKEYADWMWTLFQGKAPTITTADVTGTISTAVNKLGTSVIKSTGLASVVVIPSTGAANLKFGKYVLVAVSATTLDLYCSTDADFARGTAGSFLTDSLKVAAALTITTAANTDVASFGLRLTGGAGTIAFVTGDTATFEVKPPSSKNMEVIVGGASDVSPEFGCIAMAQKQGTGELFELDIFRCRGSGLPINFKEKAWSDAQIKAMALFDSALNGVYKVRHLIP